KRKRFQDKIVLPEVAQLVPEVEAYMQLLSFEQKLDKTLRRKKYDIQEALKRPMKTQHKLRIYVSHSFIPGTEPEKEGDEGTVPMWELRVEGRLIDEHGDKNATTPSSSAPGTKQGGKRKFSSFFKSLVIELDKDIYGPDNHLVEWHRTPTTNETDGFQVKRPGDRDVSCTILLLLDYNPMKFKLAPKLAKLLGVAMESRPKIIELLWQYVKAHKLQDAADRDVINCDSYLEPIFGVKRMRFMEIPQRLTHLLHQPDPLVLTHTIRYNSGEKNTCCYDIDVEMDDPVKVQMQNFLQNHQSMPDIGALDQRIYDIVEQINEWKTRRDFYAGFADDPKTFIQKWLASQSRDLKTINEQQMDQEQERRADHYYQPHIQEGVFRYLYGKVQQRRQELEYMLGVK
ncbi:UNVERIFIED_CONTAM: Brahma-associated protein of 60 kDa, partial [Eudyptes robustus]